MPNNNITEVQILRGTSASNAVYVGLPGVLTADLESSAVTGRGIVRLHDGETAGGYIIGGEGGGGGDTYTNTTPVPVTLGGISASSTFSAVPLTEMFDRLLYPYQLPAFSTFLITAQNPTLEVGATISAGTKEFTWTTSNLTNITPNSISIFDWTNSTTVPIASSLSTTSPANVSVSAVTKTSATSHVYRISGSNTQNTGFSRDFTVNWRWRMYWGTGSFASATASDITGSLISSSLVTNSTGTFTFGAGGYKYIAYPTVFGLKSTFKDQGTGFDVDMQEADTLSITNTNGVATNYYIHRSTNVLGGAITITVS
jgi:hypothetical protein